MRAPIASWHLRPAVGSAIAMRHGRPNAAHRVRYYSHHWPGLADRDLLERPGRWVVLWAAVALIGIVVTFASLALGDGAVIVGWLNLALLALLLVAHATNAVVSRRRRSVLMAPVLVAAVAIGAAHMAGSTGTRWVDVLVLVFVVWMPIAAADVVAPGSTYLTRRHHGQTDRTDR